MNVYSETRGVPGRRTSRTDPESRPVASWSWGRDLYLEPCNPSGLSPALSWPLEPGPK